MTLSDYASLSTAVSGIAVTLSLIYLAIQTQQNTRNTRAQIRQGAAARTASIRMAVANPDVARLWIAGNGGEPTAEELQRLQFNSLCALVLDSLEDHYLQHEAGLTGVEHFARNIQGFRGLMRQPGLRAFWNERRLIDAPGAPRFCAFVDSLCTEEPTPFTPWV